MIMIENHTAGMVYYAKNSCNWHISSYHLFI